MGRIYMKSGRVFMLVQLELSRDEARLLEMFLLMTTKYREDQVQAYRRLIEGWGSRGGTSEVTLQKYADNAQHWMEQCVAMDAIRKRVSTVLQTPERREDNI